jgi:esterase/lipase
LPALESALRLATQEGILAIDNGWCTVNRLRLDAHHAFHDVRLRNPVRVIANELEPLREAVKAVTTAINLPEAELRRRVCALLHHEDQVTFTHEHQAAESDAGCKPPEIGAPFLLPGRQSVAVVLSHGYLASPREVTDLAQALQRAGATVHGVRLAGHGTSPEQLARVRWQAWQRSYRRAFAAACAGSDRVVLAGFSMGGLLALMTAADFPQRVSGVVAINAPLHLVDPASRLVPAVKAWNGLVHTLHLDRLQWAFVPNQAEWPDSNYDRNPVHGIYQLERLIHAASERLPHVQAPALILQADHDPVVTPDSGLELERRLGSDEKELRTVAAHRHGILRGEGADGIHAQVVEFLDHLADHWG